MSRERAAHLAGLDRQSLRDWVHRYNATGVEGLYDRKAPGKPSYLDAEQQAAVREIVLKGPDPAKTGIVRWRCCDLKDMIEETHGAIPPWANADAMNEHLKAISACITEGYFWRSLRRVSGEK